MIEINAARLLQTIHQLGQIGIGADGRRTRLAASDEDKLARDQVAAWMREAGMDVIVDGIGNIIGIWQTGENKEEQPVMTGSHIDTVINAGMYDGCLGVLGGIEVVRTMKEQHIHPRRPIAVCAFTNEEGVRYAPDMMGSLVFAGGLSCAEALQSTGTDGTVLGEELCRIGYAGTVEPGFLQPVAFVELHIEQGPVMDANGYQIGAVGNLQGIHWQKVRIEGRSNHAGTTPVAMRADAGLAAARVNVFCRQMVEQSGGMATIGTMRFEPDAVNVIPDVVQFTVDLRNPDKEKLDQDEERLAAYLKDLEQTDHVRITTERMTAFDPVPFDAAICRQIQKAAEQRHLTVCPMTSGAGQDAQMMARICPSAMIFVPSVKGISHNPAEYTTDEAVANGADVLLDVLCELADCK